MDNLNDEVELRAEKKARVAEKRKRFAGLMQLALLFSLLPSILNYSLYSFEANPLAQSSQEKSTVYDIEVPCPPSSNTMSLDGLLDDLFKDVDFFINAYVSAFLLYLPALIVGIWRRRWGWLCFGLAVPNALALCLILKMSGAAMLLYMLATKVAFVWFLARGRLWSKSFLFIVALYLIYSVAALMTEGFVAGIDALKLFVAVLLFALVTHGIRILYLAVVQNLKLFPELGLINSIVCLIKTFLFWSPLLLLTLPGYLANRHVSTKIEEYIYSLEYVEKTGPEPNLEHDLRMAVRARFQAQAENWCTRAHAFYDKVDRTLTDIQTDTPADLSLTVRDAYRDIVPRVEDLGLNDWEAEGTMNPFLEWGAEPAVNYVMKSIRGAYSTSVEKVERGMMAKAKQVQKEYDYARKNAIDGSTSTQELIQKYKHLIPDAYKLANQEAQRAIVAAFDYARGSQDVLQFMFLFIAIRSFLYVFGRIAFAKNTDALIGFGSNHRPSNAEEPLLTIKSLGTKITLSPEDGTDFFFARTFEAHGQAPRFVIPFGSVAPLARIRNSAYSMNHIVFRGGEDPVHFTVSGGEQFYAVHLPEGAEIVFDYRYFAGISGDVTLSSEISARISTLLLSKIVFPTAKGPGILYLRTDGEAIHGDGAETGLSVPPNRIVAWSKNTKFKTDSILRLTDIYLSAVYVKRFGDGCLLIDADKRGRAQWGVVKFLRAFISPF